jgi:hypothetical protein
MTSVQGTRDKNRPRQATTKPRLRRAWSPTEPGEGLDLVNKTLCGLIYLLNSGTMPCSTGDIRCPRPVWIQRAVSWCYSGAIVSQLAIVIKVKCA